MNYMWKHVHSELGDASAESLPSSLSYRCDSHAIMTYMLVPLLLKTAFSSACVSNDVCYTHESCSEV